MDIRRYLFEPLDGKVFNANLTPVEPGILAGSASALSCAQQLGLSVLSLLPDGSNLRPGMSVMGLRGSAELIARAEEELLGRIGKPSGVATAAGLFTARAAGRTRIVCGAWKKVTPEQRKQLREAIDIGGAGMRVLDQPFVYLDKNYVRMFGGISEAVARAGSLDGRSVVVQFCGENRPISREAVLAWESGAQVLMVDSGKISDLIEVIETAKHLGFRHRVKIAFGGGVTLENLDDVLVAGPDIVDVGRAIIDAPILDFRLKVQPM